MPGGGAMRIASTSSRGAATVAAAAHAVTRRPPLFSGRPTPVSRPSRNRRGSRSTTGMAAPPAMDADTRRAKLATLLEGWRKDQEGVRPRTGMRHVHSRRVDASVASGCQLACRCRCRLSAAGSTTSGAVPTYRRPGCLRLSVLAAMRPDGATQVGQRAVLCVTTGRAERACCACCAALCMHLCCGRSPLWRPRSSTTGSQGTAAAGRGSLW